MEGGVGVSWRKRDSSDSFETLWRTWQSRKNENQKTKSGQENCGADKFWVFFVSKYTVAEEVPKLDQNEQYDRNNESDNEGKNYVFKSMPKT